LRFRTDPTLDTVAADEQHERRTGFERLFQTGHPSIAAADGILVTKDRQTRLLQLGAQRDAGAAVGAAVAQNTCCEACACDMMSGSFARSFVFY